jgi:hypothetical protein
MIEFKCLHLLNQKNISLHLGIFNSIKNYRINLQGWKLYDPIT